MGDDKYDVTDFGPACGYRIECGGATVWTGVVSRRGSYETHSTTLPAERLGEVLRLARVGDRREAAKADGTQRAPADAPSAEHPVGPKSEARPKAKESAPQRTAEPKAKRPAKPKASASARAPAAPPSSKAKRPAKPKASGPEPVAAAPSKAEHGAKRPAKRPAKPKAANSPNGPLTQRTPPAPASAKPHSHRAAPNVDDKAVLEGLMEKLRKEDPSTAQQGFDTYKRIWLAGGREATVEWMKQHTFPSAQEAFYDWMEKNFEAAQAMLHAAPHSAAKRAEVA